jgi:1-aminocyclopropane-1-carboxylate deaminase/D-cysteine desulfhydrase-like pyridoxal-dependent ACC family enzyme
VATPASEYLEVSEEIVSAAERIVAADYTNPKTETQDFADDAVRVARGLLDVVYKNKAV